MACYCADWCNGYESCVDRAEINTIEKCKAECRCRGRAFLAYVGQFPCGLRATEGFFYNTLTVCEGPEPTNAFFGIICIRPDQEGQIESLIIEQFEPWLARWHPTCRLLRITEYYRLPVEPVFNTSYCPSLEQMTHLPCCIGGSCIQTSPAECSHFGGTWAEGDQFQEQDPCNNPSGSHPCNVGPCCGDGQFDCNSNLPGGCGLTTREHCVNDLGRHWSRPGKGGMGCHRPGACGGGSLVCDLPPDCVGGGSKDDYAPTFRPTHHQPPIHKPWKEGFAEAVSINPQRNLQTFGDARDCMYHYADAAPVKNTPRGDRFMLVTCSQQSLVQRSTHLGPVVLRNGRARFSLAYRAYRAA